MTDKNYQSHHELSLEPKIPGMTDQLVNHFKNLAPLSYKTAEISLLHRQYDWSTHPLAQEINKLLAATATFRRSTDVGLFKDIRDANVSEKELRYHINQMGQALNVASLKLDADFSEHDKEIFTTAIQYSIQSIQNRLQELKTQNDKIYNLYLYQDNELKSFLTRV